MIKYRKNYNIDKKRLRTKVNKNINKKKSITIVYL